MIISPTKQLQVPGAPPPTSPSAHGWQVGWRQALQARALVGRADVLLCRRVARGSLVAVQGLVLWVMPVWTLPEMQSARVSAKPLLVAPLPVVPLPVVPLPVVEVLLVAAPTHFRPQRLHTQRVLFAQPPPAQLAMAAGDCERLLVGSPNLRAAPRTECAAETCQRRAPPGPPPSPGAHSAVKAVARPGSLAAQSERESGTRALWLRASCVRGVPTAAAPVPAPGRPRVGVPHGPPSCGHHRGCWHAAARVQLSGSAPRCARPRLQGAPAVQPVPPTRMRCCHGKTGGAWCPQPHPHPPRACRRRP